MAVHKEFMMTVINLILKFNCCGGLYIYSSAAVECGDEVGHLNVSFLYCDQSSD